MANWQARSNAVGFAQIGYTERLFFAGDAIARRFE
jgi:hypothetical protein